MALKNVINWIIGNSEASPWEMVRPYTYKANVEENGELLVRYNPMPKKITIDSKYETIIVRKNEEGMTNAVLDQSRRESEQARLQQQKNYLNIIKNNRRLFEKFPVEDAVTLLRSAHIVSPENMLYGTAWERMADNRAIMSPPNIRDHSLSEKVEKELRDSFGKKQGAALFDDWLGGVKIIYNHAPQRETLIFIERPGKSIEKFRLFLKPSENGKDDIDYTEISDENIFKLYSHVFNSLTLPGSDTIRDYLAIFL